MMNFAHWLPVLHAAAGTLLAALIVGVAIAGWRLLASPHAQDRSAGAWVMLAAVSATGAVFYVATVY